MRESDLQKRCMRLAKGTQGRTGNKAMCVNIHGGGWSNKGFPDLLVFCDGKCMAIELKNEGSGYEVQPDQEVWRARFARASVPWRVCRSEKEFANAMREEFGLDRPVLKDGLDDRIPYWVLGAGDTKISSAMPTPVMREIAERSHKVERVEGDFVFDGVIRVDASMFDEKSPS